MALLNFDASTVEPRSAFTPIPAGDYICVAEASEMKVANSGNGEYLQIELKVIEGPQEGRRLWERLSLKHSNQTTSEIAYRTLSSICHAVGKTTISDSAELHGIPMKVRVIVKESQQYGPQNEIRGYSPVGGAQAAAPAQATAPAQAAAPAQAGDSAATATPPWKR